MAGYGTDQGLTDWLAANGYSLPEGAPSAAVLRERGSAYIDATYGPRFRGQPTEGVAQERAWPRTGASVYGSALASTVIPVAVVNAAYRAAHQVAIAPASLTAISSSAGVVKREKVDGAVEVEYFEAKQAEGQPYDPLMPSAATPSIAEIDGMLAPYLAFATTGFGAWSSG